jgi:malonate decarboxylase delta subunit
MEKLTFEFLGGTAVGGPHDAKLVGVVGSGNLEVLIEQAELQGRCVVEVLTAARGFGKIWQAVLDDFFARHRLANARISINDVGATPAVVALRLDQAAEEFSGGGA